MKDETLLLIGAGVLAYFFLKGKGTAATSSQPASATLGQSLQNLSNDISAATNQATGLSTQAQQLFGQSGS